MTLDLGTLFAHVAIEDVQFERSYVRLVRQFADLGVKAGVAATGTGRLDESLTQTAAAGNAAATGLGRADQAMAGAGVSASDAAVATGALRSATTEAALAASKLAQAQLRQTAAQERLDALLATGTATTRQLASAQATLIAANDRVALSNDRVAETAGVSGHRFQQLGHGMLIAGGVIAAAFAIAGKAALDFDAKMALVRTLARATPAQMTQLRAAALSVGQAYGYSATQVADAEAELVKAGVSVKDIIGGALVGALTLAAAGQEDVAQATETAAVAMTQFRLSGKDVPHIADLLAAGADKALGSVSDLSQALRYGGLAAAQAHMSIEETVGVLAELAQSGQIGSTAGSQLAMMLRNLEKPTAQAQVLMKSLGFTVYDGSGQMLSFSAIAGELHDKLGRLAPAQRDAALATLFTSRAVRAANVLMRDGAAGVDAWTAKVNTSGFAALQAAGKMDSLSGDLTKLKAALQAAFIGTGESAQGPLRTVTQDVTSVVEAWMRLPGPVRTAAQAILGVAGVVTLVGGAALLAVPKIAAFDVALKEMSNGAVSARGALSALGKGTAVVAALIAIYEGAKALGNLFSKDTAPDVNQVTSALVDMSKQGTASSRDLLAFITALGHLPTSLGMTAKAATSVDTALSDLVTGGHLDMAQSDFAQINEILHKSGMSTAQITALFPQFAKALSDSATSAKEAGTGVDQFGNHVNAAGKSIETATDAAKKYSDALHALADPLFAMNQALGDLASKQKAANQAVHKYGANSKQAKQAQLDLASSALGAAAAAKTLTASVKDGTTSLSGAKAQLHQWVQAGLITAAQAKAVAASFGGLIGKADHLSQSLHGAADGAHAAGVGVGHDFAAGVAAGIAAGSPGAEHQAIVLAQRTAQAARSQRGFHSHSPSRVGHKIGTEFGDGVAGGIDASTAHVVTATGHLTKAATLKAAQGLQASLQTQIQTVASHLSSLRSNAASLSSGVASGITGTFDIANAPNVSVKGLTSFLSYGAKASGQFDKLERQLIRRHLDPRLVQQLETMFANDPGMGIAAAKNILAGGSGAIHRLDRLERDIGRNAQATGQAISKQQFGTQINRVVGKLDELRSELRSLDHTVSNLGRQARGEQHKATVRTHK